MLFRSKEVGEILLATPGMAEAMAKYMTPMVFEEAFLRYVDSAKPELKTAAERMGNLSHSYCEIGRASCRERV